MRFAFDYDAYKALEKTIGPVEEQVIRADFHVVVNGNSSFEGHSPIEMQDAFWIFRHGWLCARLAIGDKHDADPTT